MLDNDQPPPTPVDFLYWLAQTLAWPTIILALVVMGIAVFVFTYLFVSSLAI